MFLFDIFVFAVLTLLVLPLMGGSRAQVVIGLIILGILLYVAPAIPLIIFGAGVLSVFIGGLQYSGTRHASTSEWRRAVSSRNDARD